MDAIEQIASEQGFECMGRCPAPGLAVRAEVRDMCAADKCAVYGHSWACPPACGEIADFEQQMHEHAECLVVQTVAQMEDDFDVETMEEASAQHKSRFAALVDALHAAADEVAPEGFMALSAGTCTLCATCTYPDEPCRFPDKRLVSMEAAGLVVSEVCTQAGIPYNHGPQTIAYSSCIVYG